MTDAFIYLDEIALGGDRQQFRVTRGHLRQIAMAQHGVYTKKRFSDAAMASYPRFTKGPGGRYGIFESQLSEYWSRLQQKHENVVDAASRFTRRRTRG